ncbi:YfdX family protein [Orbus mooreae]|uniref:YfdX family protein n=1 Tax=Orbus mooreae TaxID=3074107 RepID=UPI00370DC78C
MKKIITATALSLALISSFSWADAGKTDAMQTATNSVTAQQLKDVALIAEQGFNAMHNIQYARLAIFGGKTDLAMKLTDQAAKLLADDSIEWKDFVKQAKDPALTKNDSYVVIDATISLAENYVVTPEKQSAIDKANEKLRKGDKKGALEELRLADIAVNETEYLMPLNITRQAVAKAQQLLKDGKYYEANLALLSTEEAIVVNSETLIDAN